MTHSSFLAFNSKISKSVESALLSVFRSSQWSEGPYIRRLESFYEDSFSLYASAFSSGGQAMSAIAQYYSNKPVVAFQSNTYYASIHPWLPNGHKLVLIRTDRPSLMPSYSQIEHVIDLYHVNVLVLTHIGGYPNPDIVKISQLCRDKDVILIEDCAHSPFASIGGQFVGSFGNASIFSFYPTKPIPCGEGGLLLTSDEKLRDFSKLSRNYGKYRDSYGNILHAMPSLGNARISEFNAAVAYTLSTNYDSILDSRRRIAEIYDVKLPGHFIRYSTPGQCSPSFYKYIVLGKVTGMTTSPVYDQFNQLHSILLQNHINFDDPFPDCDLPIHSCLPIYPSMDEKAINEVICSLAI